MNQASYACGVYNMEINGEQAQLNVTSAPCKKSVQEENCNGLDITWVARLFAKFQARYGNKWTSALPTVELQHLAINEWSEGLAGLTGEEIKHGLNTWKDSWPPTVHEFREACKHDPASASHKPFPSLPPPKKKLTRSLGKFLRDIRDNSGETEPQD